MRDVITNLRRKTNHQSMSDSQRPSTWRKYKSGLCEDCWAGCCTLPLETNVHDLIRLGLVTEEEAAMSLKKMATRLVKERVLQSYNLKTQVFIIAQRAGRDCIFLDEQRKCTVYDKRPTVCREFPKIGPRPGFCPYRKKETLK